MLGLVIHVPRARARGCSRPCDSAQHEDKLAFLYMRIVHVEAECSLSRRIAYRNSVLQAKVFQNLT